MNAWVIALVVVLVLVIVVLFLGFRRVEIGAVGLVISAGRRTGEIRGEGWTWVIPFMQRLECVFLRERQFDLEDAQYYTSDRGRLRFSLTVRVSVSDPALLLNQGPGTYAPFARPGDADAREGAEERNLPVEKMMQNAVREAVAQLSIHDAMFGGAGGSDLKRFIRDTIDTTCRRWGLSVVEVWVTDVEAARGGLQGQLEHELTADMRERGDRIKQVSEARKGSAFVEEAMLLQRRIQQTTGQVIPLEALQQQLATHHFNERALDVAQRAAGQPDMMRQVYAAHFGVPMPVAPVALGAPGVRMALPGAATMRCARCGTTAQVGARFCDECGGQFPASPQLTPAALPRPGHTASRPTAGLRAGSYTVGRAGTAIVLDGEGISRCHCRLDVQGTSVMVTDLASANGTWVNGRRLPANQASPVSPHDVLGLGHRVTMQVGDLLSRA